MATEQEEALAALLRKLTPEQLQHFTNTGELPYPGQAVPPNELTGVSGDAIIDAGDDDPHATNIGRLTDQADNPTLMPHQTSGMLRGADAQRRQPRFRIKIGK